MVGTLHLDTCGKGKEETAITGDSISRGKNPTATLRIREEGNDL